MTQAETRLTFEEYASVAAEAWVRHVLTVGTCKYVKHGVFHSAVQISSPEFGLLPIAAQQMLEAGQ